jgi:two-component system chemotaxis response regulator CheB
VLLGVGTVPATAAVSGEPLGPGRIYAAVTDRHPLVGAGDTVRLSHGPRHNRVRPSAGALFRSAARWCGPRVIGVVLSGTLDDGAAGLASIARAGGLAFVQRPEEAKVAGMPRAALQAVPTAKSMPAAHLGRVLARPSVSRRRRPGPSTRI